jgi:Flp pilus assembly protein TadD
LSQFDQAAEVLENVLAETGGNAPVHMRLGKAYEALGDWDRAEEEYHRALELDENLEEALELLQNLEFRRTQGAA